MGVDGLEVYYPEHTLQQVDQYLQLSQQLDLLVTGGSDFHGTETTRTRPSWMYRN